MSFNVFNFHQDIKKGIKIAGFKEPSPIQSMAIPAILEGKDLVGQAYTGTGKTAAFGLPILQKIAAGECERALVITPTRELASQISDELYFLGRFAGVRTLTVYGGVGYGRQIALIHKGVQIVVATPGRLKDLYKKGKIDAFNPEIVVLDEADEMLDMGFLDDIKEIFEYIPQTRQTLLFSATMPEPIKELATSILYHPQYVSVINEDETVNNIIEQRYYVIEESQRDEAIVRLLQSEEIDKCIIFCRMKREVDRLQEYLEAEGYNAKGLHGDVEQMDRDEIIKSYRRGQIKILIATDVAARGLDIKGVSHVFNYHIPFDPQSYVHRIGRTGRAGKSGQAITLVSTEEFKELQRIQKEVGAEMKLATIDNVNSIENEDIVSIIESIDEINISTQANKVFQNIKNEHKDALLLRLITFYLHENGKQFYDVLGYSSGEVENLISEYEVAQKRAKKSKHRKKS